ncbi:MAG: mannonate dehydratase [Verrucomicrobiales bacterium]|nr:mannonate dehydratase [Verrucomicrobiales bacterium]
MKIALLVTPFSDENLALAAQVGVEEIVATWPGLDPAILDGNRRRVEAHGMKLGVIERYVPTLDFIHGTENCRQQTENFKTLLRNMGEAEVPVLCYSWMPNDDWQRTRLDLPDRGGALVTEFDIRNPDKAINATGFNFSPTDPTPASKLWENLERFLNEVIPVAEDAGVRLAMHPDDPPMAEAFGQQRIMHTPEAFERMVKMVDSPANGICLCQGSFASSAAEYDIPALIRRLAPHIVFAHFRDVTGAVPHFQETFHDLGKTDMAACIRAYQDCCSNIPIRPDHVPTLHGESNKHPGYHMMGRLWAVGYMRGLLDASTSAKQG